MKLLIVDDEKHVRDVIRLLIQWDLYPIEEIFEASDGQAAIEIIQQQKPEIIFTDMMMPHIPGAELLEWIQRYAPESKTIVISGHNDFTLLRDTIHYGGRDYILKPIDGDVLHEALTKAISSWQKDEVARKQQLQRNIEMNQMRPMYGDKLLSDFTQDAHHVRTVTYLLNHQFALPEATLCSRVSVITIAFLHATYLQKFDHDVDLLFFSLMNICNELLLKNKSGVAFRNWHNEYEIILYIWKESPPAVNVLNEMNQAIHHTYGFKLDFGLGHIHSFPHDLKTSYHEASLALKQRDMLHRQTWIHTLTLQENKVVSRLQFNDYADRFHLAMQSGHKAHIEEVVDHWIQTLCKQPLITAEQVERWWKDFHIIRQRWMQELLTHVEDTDLMNTLYEDSQQLSLIADEQGLLSLSKWKEQLILGFHQLSQLLLQHQHKENKVIYEICSYIEKHYQENLTLQHISNQFFISREYISRKFKQEFKVNFSDYMSRFRIEKSKLLLLNPHLRIAQIAEEVGYPDVKYFSKVFKKIAGVSPNQFRKQNTSI